MTKQILNIDDIEYQDWGHGERFAAKLGQVAMRIGANKLGYNVTVLPAGKRAFPIHNHRVNEEMFFVLEGEGELRVGAERHPLRRGDFVACPPGGPETAHQIVNTSTTADLKYLSVSTMLVPEVVDYPDSGKTGVRVDRTSRFLTRTGESLDYWEGE